MVLQHWTNFCVGYVHKSKPLFFDWRLLSRSYVPHVGVAKELLPLCNNHTYRAEE